MKYDWEDKAVKKLMPKIKALNENLDGKFAIWGFAIENEETGEACFVKVCGATGDILDIDLAQDVAGDAEAVYQEEMNAASKVWKGN